MSCVLKHCAVSLATCKWKIVQISLVRSQKSGIGKMHTVAAYLKKLLTFDVPYRMMPKKAVDSKSAH